MVRPKVKTIGERGGSSPYRGANCADTESMEGLSDALRQSRSPCIASYHPRTGHPLESKDGGA